MASNSDNRRRAFADVVTIDAWHDDFGADVPKADLHADVVFGTARIGGESESHVRFRLSVRRAEIVVVVPESEPVKIDRRSISRDAPDLQGRMTETVERTTRARIKGAVSGAVSASGVTGSLTAESDAESTISASEKLEMSSDVRLMFVTQSKTADGHYRWSVESNGKAALQGRPWDGAKEPRLTLIDIRKDRSKGIPPTVRVEIRCRREDLIITDLEIKNESLWDTAKRRAGFKNRLAAAEAYIRERLSDEGLEVKNIDEAFSQLTLGTATAESA
jgi:hypothetical protein